MYAPARSSRAGSMQYLPRQLPPMSLLADQVLWRSSAYQPGYLPRDWQNDQAIVRVHVDSSQYRDPSAANGLWENYAARYPALSQCPAQNNEYLNSCIQGRIALSLSHFHSSGRVEHVRLNGR